MEQRQGEDVRPDGAGATRRRRDAWRRRGEALLTARSARRALAPLAAGVLLLAWPLPPAFAECSARTGFALYQCGDRAFFQPPPEGAGAVTAVFWQIGYGNRAVNNGQGHNGTGIAPAGVFSGNDSGLWKVPLIDPASIPGGEIFPQGALCLGPANWSNAGVDGCCDNRRYTGRGSAQDGFLNPNFDLRKLARQQVFELTDIKREDYPMAVLLTEETGRWFAAAAVAPAPRPDDRPDERRGHFTLAAVVDGDPNPLTGERNAIPWQEAPRIRLEATGESLGRDHAGRELLAFQASWDPVVIPSDGSHIPSEAWEMEDPGVGVADMGPLVRYAVERVSLLPGMLGEDGYPRPEILLWERVTRTRETRATVALHEDSCVRVVARLGREPTALQTSVVPCALGRCGDVGYAVPGPAVCLEGPLLKRVASGPPDRR